MPELLCDAPEGFEVGHGFGDVSDNEVRAEPGEVRVCDPLDVADPPGYISQLVAESEGLGDRVRPKDGGGAAVERVRERCWVSGAPGEFQCLAT